MSKITNRRINRSSVYQRYFKNFTEWNLKQKFDFFLKKFKEQTGQYFEYDHRSYGIELMEIKRLNMKTIAFKEFINWLVENHSLPFSIFKFRSLKNKFAQYLSEKNNFGFEKK